MDMYEAAALSAAERDTAVDDLSDRVQGMRSRRGRLLAGQAIAELRDLAPDAAWVVFWGPQEPGDRASVRALLRRGGLPGGAVEPVFGEHLADGLELVEVLLTLALEDSASFEVNGDGEYVIDLTRR